MPQANGSTPKSHGGVSTLKAYRLCAQSPNKNLSPGGGSSYPRPVSGLQEEVQPDIDTPRETIKA